MFKRFVVVACALWMASPILAEDGGKKWEGEGKWNNRKYGTSGPLKCTATIDKNGTWKATFTGTFEGDPFKYEASFKSKAGKKQVDLAGTAKIRGHDYKWTGAVKGETLTGKYRSSVGYFGEFVLKEKKADKKVGG